MLGLRRNYEAQTVRSSTSCDKPSHSVKREHRMPPIRDRTSRVQIARLIKERTESKMNNAMIQTMQSPRIGIRTIAAFLLSWTFFVIAGPAASAAEIAPDETAVSEANQHFSNGKALYTQQDYAKGCPEFNRAIQLNPAYVEARVMWGLC